MILQLGKNRTLQLVSLKMKDFQSWETVNCVLSHHTKKVIRSLSAVMQKMP